MSRNTVMRASFRIATLLGASVVLLLRGCDGIARSLYLAGCDHDIKNSTRAVETARDDAQRAAGYSARGRAYSEKDRYSRAFKLIPADEYSRLFGLAIKDHDQAIAFDPGSAERYFSQGRPITTGPPGGSRQCQALDRAGSRRFQEGCRERHPTLPGMGPARPDSSVDLRTGHGHQRFHAGDGLNPIGSARLADAYCIRGSLNQKQKKYHAAITHLNNASSQADVIDSNFVSSLIR